MTEENTGKEKLEMAGLKIPAPLKQRFMGHRDRLGLKHDEYADLLCTLVEQHQLDDGTDSPVLKEQTEIEQALAKVARVCNSVITLSVERQLTCKEDADKTVETAREEVVGLKTLLAEQKEFLGNLEKEKIETDKIVTGLQDAAESTAILKEAWEADRSRLTDQIADLGDEAKEARDLKTKIGDIEKSLANTEKALGLAELQAENDQFTIEDLRSRLNDTKMDHQSAVKKIEGGHDRTIQGLNDAHKKALVSVQDAEQTKTSRAVSDYESACVNFREATEEHQGVVAELKSQIALIKEESKTALDSLKVDSKESIDKVVKTLSETRANLTTTTEALNAEKLACADRILEIEKAKAKEIGLLAGNVASLENRLANQDNIQKRIISLESEVQSGTEENNVLVEQVKDLEAQLKKKAGTKK